MTKQTASLNLSKPEITDKIVDTITQLASNFDVIDSSLADSTSQLANISVDAKIKYGAKGDGSTDDSTAIQNAVNYVNANGGGMVYLPKGTYFTNELSLLPNVILNGAGENVTILKLNNGRNKDFITINQASYSGLTNLTLDANKANNTLGSVVLITNTNQAGMDYPRQLKIAHVVLKNGAEHGISITSPTNSPLWISQFRFIKIESCNKWGIYNYKGTDNSFYAIDIFQCTYGAVFNQSGGSNIFTGGKWFNNGNSLVSGSGNATLYDKYGSHNFYCNIDIQDNYGDGVTLEGAYFTTFSNVIVDACGITGTTNFSQTGLVFKAGCYNIDFKGQVTNYLGSFRPNQWQGVSIDSTCRDIYIDGQIDDRYMTTPLNINANALNIFIRGNYGDSKRKGATANRPTYLGQNQMYFDSTLNKPIIVKTPQAKEIDTLTIATGASTSGNITITLNSVAVNVAVNAGDSANTIASKIGSTTFTGWSTVVSGNIVVFTYYQPQTCTTPTYSGGTTGSTGSFVVTSAGTTIAWVDYTGTSV